MQHIFLKNEDGEETSEEKQETEKGEDDKDEDADKKEEGSEEKVTWIYSQGMNQEAKLTFDL